MDAKIDIGEEAGPAANLRSHPDSAPPETSPARRPKAKREKMRCASRSGVIAVPANHEPRWVVTAEELGIDLGDDHDDTDI
jgi:hypothetical protein